MAVATMHRDDPVVAIERYTDADSDRLVTRVAVQDDNIYKTPARGPADQLS